MNEMLANKFYLGQTLYWIKYTNDYPEVRSFEVGSIKFSKKGWQYATDTAGTSYISEYRCFITVDEAIQNGCQILVDCKNDKEEYKPGGCGGGGVFEPDCKVLTGYASGGIEAVFPDHGDSKNE